MRFGDSDVIKWPDFFVVHHSASGPVGVETIRRWHMDKGWKDIGYALVIEADGEIRSGRPFPFQGAHALKVNRNSIGVCVVGHNGKPGLEWTTEQLNALDALWIEFKRLFPDIQLRGHRDVAEEGHTECPGVDVRDLLLSAEEEEE